MTRKLRFQRKGKTQSDMINKGNGPAEAANTIGSQGGI